ncbi:MAG: PocR ligand-binding domain-containing protein [Bacteroidota bacterium]
MAYRRTDQEHNKVLDDLVLLDLFTREELQHKQDVFSEAMSVASLITLPDGTPVTRSSNFSSFCQLIRQTSLGRQNCYKSDAELGKANAQKPMIMPCLSGGLWDAGVSIVIEGKHLGNWLIGQIKNNDLDKNKILSYADEIGADKKEFEEALEQVPETSLDKFQKTAEMLFIFVNELTQKAYTNYILKKEVAKRKQTSEKLRKTLEELKESQEKLKKQNQEYLSINEELKQTNEEYHALNDEVTETNQKLTKTLQKLEESNQRNQSLLQAIPDMMFLFNQEGIFLDCHTPANARTIIPRENFIQKNFRDLLPENIVDLHFKAQKKLFETQQPQQYQYTVKTDQGLRYYESKMVIHNQSEILAIVRDITDTKKAEREIKASQKKYQLLLDNVFDGIYMIKGTKFEYVNKQLCLIMGYTPQEMLGKDFNLWNTLTDKGREVVKSRYEARVRGEDIPHVYEFQIITPKGEIKEVEVSTTEVSTDKTPLILGIMRDVTNIKKSKELKQEVDIARKSAEFKQKFLANMSHEIRTPLTGMMGLADILSKTSIDEKQKLYVDNMRQSGENLRHIINLILDYSKIESGQIKLVNTVFPASAIFDDVENLFHSICHKPIKLQIKISPKVPSYIKTDRQRLNQILNNLVSNAVKFTNEGEINLSVFVEKQKRGVTSNKEYILLKIEVTDTDTGIGIDPSLHKHLFKPFSQIEANEIRTMDGTGLGLSICRELSVLLGGNIGLESEPGKGSRFWFTIQAEISDQSQMPVSNKNVKSKKRHKDKQLNILLVEDKKVNQMVIKLMLEELGHQITIASDGAKSVEVFTPGIFDLILMDIQMPVMDGIAATNQLKKLYNNLPPIVGLSANAFEGDKEKYMNLGMDDYLTKPVKTEDFEILLDRLFPVETK